jgi:hypothetical protein
MLQTHKANLLTSLFYYNYSHNNNKLYMTKGKNFSLNNILPSHPNFHSLSEKS